MSLYIAFKYLHFVAVFGVVSSLIAQHLFLEQQMSRRELSRIYKIDAVYGFSALLVLAVGLCLWFAVGKPASFYTSNSIFHLKLTLFIIMGLISIAPTRYFMKHRKGDPDEVVLVPKRIVMLVRIELLILFLIPLLAVIMAQGVGAQ
jgi:putative membrane protein